MNPPLLENEVIKQNQAQKANHRLKLKEHETPSRFYSVWLKQNNHHWATTKFTRITKKTQKSINLINLNYHAIIKTQKVKTKNIQKYKIKEMQLNLWKRFDFYNGFYDFIQE
jgi:ribosomal protein L25 (general stress protein Ctc)